VDLATVRHVSARSQLADLIWEAPVGLTGEHSQLLLAAIQADCAGRAEAAGQLWDKARAVWSRAWTANLAALELMQTSAWPGSPRSSRSAG